MCAFGVRQRYDDAEQADGSRPEKLEKGQTMEPHLHTLAKRTIPRPVRPCSSDGVCGLFILCTASVPRQWALYTENTMEGDGSHSVLSLTPH